MADNGEYRTVDGVLQTPPGWMPPCQTCGKPMESIYGFCEVACRDCEQAKFPGCGGCSVTNGVLSDCGSSIDKGCSYGD